MQSAKLRFLFILPYLILCFFLLQGSFAEEDEGKIISSLRELATRLGWPQDIFVGVKGPDEDVRIFGIADVPFSELNQPREKSYVQWLSGHKGPLEKILDRHLKSYKKLGFYVVPVEGVGNKAYRAFLLSYLVQDNKELVLSESRDVVEILSGLNLLTLRDERLTPDADAWAIFEEVYERSLADHFIQPLPQEFLQGPVVGDAFKQFPERVLPETLFPVEGDLPLDSKGWGLFSIEPEGQRGQLLSFGKRYRYMKKLDEVSSPEVRIFLYAYASGSEAELAYKIYRKKLKPRKDRIVFVQSIFLCDLDVSWEGVTWKRRKELLRSFRAALRRRIEEAFRMSRKS